MLKTYNIEAEYEPGRIAYTPPTKHYTPDFILPNGIIIETKGYFVAGDRAKHLLIKQQYPALDLRFVFQRPQTKLNSSSRTTYAGWCEKHGFLWARKTIPLEWINAPVNHASLELIKEVLIPKCQGK